MFYNSYRQLQDKVIQTLDCFHTASHCVSCQIFCLLIQKHLLMVIKLIANNIDELGNWCHQRLVVDSRKYQPQQGGSMATLRAGTSPASSHHLFSVLVQHGYQ